MHDVFARVGGPNGDPNAPVAADTMVKVGSGFASSDVRYSNRSVSMASVQVRSPQGSGPCNGGTFQG